MARRIRRQHLLRFSVLVVVVGLFLLGRSLHWPWQVLFAPAVLIAPITSSFNSVGQCLVNGVMLKLKPRFEVGDGIRIEGYEGTVSDIGLIYTHLQTADGQEIPVPNSKWTVDIVSIRPEKEKECTAST